MSKSAFNINLALGFNIVIKRLKEALKRSVFNPCFLQHQSLKTPKRQ